MHIEIDRLNEQELLDMNHQIVERLRMLRDVKAHVTMMDFRIGERVMFEADNQEPVIGTLTKYNRKSVTVVADNGMRWNVSPGLIRRAATRADDSRASQPPRKPESAQLLLIKR